MIYFTVDELEIALEQQYPLRIDPDQIRYYSIKYKTLVVNLGETEGNMFLEEIAFSDKNINDELKQIFDVGFQAYVKSIFPDKTVFISRKEFAKDLFDNTLEKRMIVSDFCFVGMCKHGAIFNYNGIMALCKFEEISIANISDCEKFLRVEKLHKLLILHKGTEPFPLLVSRKRSALNKYVKAGDIISVISTGIIYKDMIEVEITPNQRGMMIAPKEILKPIPRKFIAIVTSNQMCENVPILKYVN